MMRGDQALRRLRVLAAVYEHFDAQTLIAAVAAAGRGPALLQQLAQDSIEIEVGDGHRWTLAPAARQAALEGVSQEELKDVLRQAEPLDALGRGFAAVLGLRKNGDAEAAQRYRAVELLRQADTDGKAVEFERISRELRDEIARQSTAATLQNTLRSPLRGRKAVLQFLRAFAADGARAIEQPQALPGATLYRASLKERRWPLVPALLLSGIGGVGKSAVVAELIRHERGAHWERRVVIHFDFDEPALKAGHQGAMTLALARQLGLARPALGDALAASRSHLREALLQIERNPSGAFEQMKFSLAVEFSKWKPLLAEHGIHDLLFVLDTLEEVTVVDFERLDSLFGWLDSLRVDAGLNSLHVIGSGRALVGEGEPQRARLWPYFLAEFQLGDLRPRAARDMLRDRFRSHGSESLIDQAWRCVETFGGNPLVLSVLARYCADKDSRGLEELLAEAQSQERRGLVGEYAQRFLNQRILERVRDPDIQPLVTPGLILRRVTPTLICDVLAGPCGLGSVDMQRATVLLEKLQNLAWLVTPDGDGVRHRRDMRRLMLPLVLEQEGERAVAVNRAAARWYAAQAEVSREHDGATLEGWYHLGLLGETASDNEADLRALGDHLGEDVEDLPPKIRALVKFAARRSLSPAEQSALPTAQQEITSKRQARTLRLEGLDRAALGKASARPIGVIGRSRWPDDTNIDVSGIGDDIVKRVAGVEPFDFSAVQDVPPHAAPDAELVKALFAAGEFEPVAAQLPTLLVEYWQRMQRGDARVVTLADEPVYLAAVAARAFAPAPVDWVALIGDPLFRAGTGDSVDPYGPAPAIVALEVLLTCPPNRPTLSSVLGIAQMDIAGNAPLRISLAMESNYWKPVLACARALGIADVPLSLAALPFLHPELVDLLLKTSAHAVGQDLLFKLTTKLDRIIVWLHWKTNGSGRDVGWHSVLQPTHPDDRLASNLAPLLNDLDDLGLSHIDQLARLVAGISVTFDFAAARGSGCCLIGLVPELYAPIRSAFQAELQPADMARLVEQVTAPLQHWPAELAPALFAETSVDRNNELLPLLLTIADYYGCLGDLVRAAGTAAPVHSRIGRVAKLFAAFEDAWRL